VAYEALAQIEINAGGALASSDPEFLHQLRVGMRRLRAALRAFRDILPSKHSKRLRRALRSVSPKLGRARDWDVLVQRLEQAHAPARLLARANDRRDRARQGARRVIASKDFARIATETSSLAADETAQSLEQFGAAALVRAHRKLMEQARGMDWQDPAQRHALRIRVKRLRYSCEFLVQAFPARRATGYIAALKAVQELLGELNDIAVGRRLVGFEADEAAFVRKAERAWTRFARRPVFWAAPE